MTQALTGSINLGEQTFLAIKQASDSQLQTILPSAVTISEDFIPPSVDAVLLGDKDRAGFYFDSVQVNISAVDSDSGVLAVYYNLDNQGYQKVDGANADFPVLTEGSHVLSYFVADKAGNNVLEKMINFEIKFLPTSKDQCKNNGWKNYGQKFKSQGNCVSFIQIRK